VDIDRRKLLVGTACSALTGAIGGRGVRPSLVDPEVSGADEWHPLTRSLLDRARRIGRDSSAPDRARVERAVRRFADLSGNTNALVIKWMDTPADAFDHLSRFGLDALLDMGSASFWRRAQPPAAPDEETFERAFEARMTANELLGVDKHGRLLMAPKLRAKSHAVSADASDGEIFRVRAVSSQIGWLETSMADVAAQTISNVEALLCLGDSERSVAIDNQMKVFDSYEQGLMATWETPDALICVPRIQI
jgi:hypothetical protein